jgi:hypothetical protein
MGDKCLNLKKCGFLHFGSVQCEAQPTRCRRSSQIGAFITLWRQNKAINNTKTYNIDVVSLTKLISSKSSEASFEEWDPAGF